MVQASHHGHDPIPGPGPRPPCGNEGVSCMYVGRKVGM